MSVAQAAPLLGISERRVRALIAAGQLHAERVGNQWVLDEAILARHEARAARPLSARSAWMLLDLASRDRREPSDLEQAAPEPSSSEQSRARRRLAALRRAPEPQRLLRSWLPRRADRVVYRAAPRDVPDLLADPRLVRSGVSDPRSGLAAAEMAEGYVRAEHLAGLVADYLLLEARDGRGNVVLHVSERPVASVSELMLAADLAEHMSPREDRRAAELVRERP